MSSTTYRTCPRSGLQFEANAEKLMLANAVAAVVFLLIGGILAVGVVLTRWPAIHWLEADTFYKVLTAHGIDMLIFWIIFFEIAVLYFCSSTLLRCRLATPKIAWLAFALMVIGAIVNNVAVYQGSSSVMMTSYVPMMAAPSFYAGLILFAVGALIGCFVFLGTLVVAKRDKTYRLNLTAMDYQHGFSLQPENINIQIIPGYQHVVNITPTKSGKFSIMCNEYCGIGHHKMITNIYVK